MNKKYNLTFYIVLTIISAVLILSSGMMTKDIDFRRKDLQFEKARVIKVINENKRPDKTIEGMFLGSQDIEVEILTGNFKSTNHIVKNSLGRLYNVNVKEGMEIIVVLYAKGDVIESISVYSHIRYHVIYLLTGLFCFLLVVIAGIKGLKSIFSLIFTGILILFFMIPSILKGYNPILLAVITSALSTSATFFMVSGAQRKTLISIIGTLFGVTIAGSMAHIARKMTYLTGVRLEEAETLFSIADETGLQFEGLVFVAILIASLGAMMDIVMTIVSSMDEIKRINPSINTKSLFSSGMNVGKDVIGTMSNTLILVFTGGLLGNIIVLIANKSPYYQYMNLEPIVFEIIQALAGSIGIVLSVPITALIGAYLFTLEKK